VGSSSRLSRSATPTNPAAEHPLAEDLLAGLAAVRRTLRRFRTRPVELSALTGAQTELVRLLRRRPGVSIADAAAELHLAANTVSTLVGQLTESGVVVRAVDDLDRRIARLDLEPGIRRKVDEWRDRRTLAVAHALAELSDAQRRRLADAIPLLGEVAARLEQQL
jgi:DNA-binding MarR family transcriptional regulator